MILQEGIDEFSSFMTDIESLLGAFTGIPAIVEALSIAFGQLFGIIAIIQQYWWIAIIISIILIVMGWAITAIFTQIALWFYKSPAKYGYTFITVLENFVAEIVISFIPLVGWLIGIIFQVWNIKRRHPELSGYGSAFLVFMFGILMPILLGMLVFWAIGGFTILQEFFAELFV